MNTYALEVCTSCQLLVRFCLSSLSGLRPSFLFSSVACLSLADSTWRRVLISSSTWNTTHTRRVQFEVSSFSHTVAPNWRYLGELGAELLSFFLCQVWWERVDRVPHRTFHRYIRQTGWVIHIQTLVWRVQVDVWDWGEGRGRRDEGQKGIKIYTYTRWSAKSCEWFVVSLITHWVSVSLTWTKAMKKVVSGWGNNFICTQQK